MEEFAEEKEAWLREFLEFPNGIPSHDTLSDVLGRIDPQAFQDAFLRWVQAALPSLSGEQICLDGKTLRGSRISDKAVHLLSAYAAQARWILRVRWYRLMRWVVKRPLPKRLLMLKQIIFWR